MSPLEAVLLGALQGLTEFLPVSSSGHLVLAEAWLGVRTPGVLFEVALHAATLAAVVIFYRRRVGELAVGVLRGRAEAWRYGGKLAVATLPAVAVGLAAREAIERQFDRPLVAAAGLLVTGALLWTTRRTLARARDPEPGWASAWWIGCAQAIAILPGISRSGSTVALALALGIEPEAAAEFSFLMSVIAIVGAVVLTLPELGGADPRLLAPVALSAAIALATGVVALALFVRLLRSRAFPRFAYYTWTLGAGALLVAVLGALA